MKIGSRNIEYILKNYGEYREKIKVDPQVAQEERKA